MGQQSSIASKWEETTRLEIENEKLNAHKEILDKIESLTKIEEDINKEKLEILTTQLKALSGDSEDQSGP